MNHPSKSKQRAERRAARVPVGDRPRYAADEGQS